MELTYYVYKHYSRSGKVLYVGCTSQPHGRMDAHKSSSPWFKQVKRITMRVYYEKAAALRAEARAIATLQPKHNTAHRNGAIANLERFLFLRRKGLTYRAIGELQRPRISRQRVHQLITGYSSHR